jgi:hypothetical protein
VPVNRGRWSSNRSELALSAAIVLATEAYIWLLASEARWTVVFPVALIALLWYRQSQTNRSLGLGFSDFVRSLRQWWVLWIVTAALFLFLGWDKLLRLDVVLRGCVYMIWCTIQQLAFQSVVYSVLRRFLPRNWVAALVAGMVFALLHAPNPVLMAGTLVWGAASSLLFENCRSVLALALLQVMFSSMLLWLVPYEVHHGLRVGPSYYRWTPPASGAQRPEKFRARALGGPRSGADLGSNTIEMFDSQCASFTMVT